MHWVDRIRNGQRHGRLLIDGTNPAEMFDEVISWSREILKDIDRMDAASTKIRQWGKSVKTGVEIIGKRFKK